jgi:hypothetical protein
MPLFAAAAAVWLVALIATPRRPLPNCPLDEVVYSEVRRHQQRLVTVAICVTILVLLASVLARPSGVDADAAAMRSESVAVRGCAQQLDSEEPVCDILRADGRWVKGRQPAAVATTVCTAAPDRVPTCYMRQLGGGWLAERLEPDGWHILGIESRPPPDAHQLGGP